MSVRRAQVALASRRSCHRCNSLLVLAAEGAMFPNELALAMRVDPSRLKKILHGYPPNYRVERSPVFLGLVAMVDTPDGAAYVITPQGKEEARRLRRQPAERRGWRF